jgi:hypothetical protein
MFVLFVRNSSTFSVPVPQFMRPIACAVNNEAKFSENSRVAYITKKLPTFYGIRMFITVFTGSGYDPFQTFTPYFFNIRFNIIRSSTRILKCGLFPIRFSDNMRWEQLTKQAQIPAPALLAAQFYSFE